MAWSGPVRRKRGYMYRVRDLCPTVLLLEDANFWTALVHDALETLPEPHHVRLVCVEDGTAAMAALGEHEPACAIIDICLPGPMNGLDVLEVIRRSSKPWVARLPAAMFTTSPSGMDIARAKSLGIDRYIGKSFGLDSLPQVQAAVRGFVLAVLERNHA